MNLVWLWGKSFPQEPWPSFESRLTDFIQVMTGMERRGGGNKLNSLSPHAPKPPVQPHIGKGPSVVRSIEVSLRALTEQGKEKGELIWEEAEMACPRYCGESPRHVHSRGLRSSAWPLLGPVQMSLPGARRDEGEEAGWNPQRSSKGA